MSNSHPKIEIGADLLEILLKDRTTNKYIRWGSDNYESLGPGFQADQEMLPTNVIGYYASTIQPRTEKSEEEKTRRTRDKAEVFTPAWVCNAQNNLVDEAWFGRKNVFNVESGTSWKRVDGPIVFPEGRTWKDYVNAERMEVACGEAPYLASRYDAVSGENITAWDRIGLIDRKFRVVHENVRTEKEWLKWAYKALQSCYGYDFQGDNVLLARKNLLYSFADYMYEYMQRCPEQKELKKAAEIISWNIWQMNGLTMTSPYSSSGNNVQQMNLFLDYGIENPENSEMEEEQIYQQNDETPCTIKDWKTGEVIEFRSMVRK